ncbi:MAG: vanadium nitrogenase [Eubacterium sp.]|nr:vanadium nitrogenase [Eubacterium sp.]
MAAFIGSFLQYTIEMVILAAIAVAGVFTGRKLRKNKDAKSATVRIGTGRK